MFPGRFTEGANEGISQEPSRYRYHQRLVGGQIRQAFVKSHGFDPQITVAVRGQILDCRRRMRLQVIPAGTFTGIRANAAM